MTARISFKVPKNVIWVKVDGEKTHGLLTDNLELVPKEVHPKVGAVKKRGYKRLFCLKRQSWISLYTASILATSKA